ncbi:hypothetical protein IPM09_02795 [Candidatus Saccharibacteria bacterium]|nr:MAG: hypothetical protein IPM09_02795 [Candidatus Saccharibacteria bacterium]
MSNNTNEGNKPVLPASVLILTIADTTWRMFVPTISLILLGNLADDTWHTKPYGLLIGATIGALIAGLLIKQQLAKDV